MELSYDDQYYLILKEFTSHTFYPICSRGTENRNFEDERLIFGQKPLFFENAYKDRDKKDGIIRPIPDVFLEATVPIINERIYQKLQQFESNITGMQFYPTVLIDDDGNFHENFYCMNFWETLDCWDRKKSNFQKGSKERMAKHDFYQYCIVNKYCLDDKVLDSIPEKKRLIFQMDSGFKYTFVHKKIADILIDANPTGINLVKVSDFEEGKQF